LSTPVASTTGPTPVDTASPARLSQALDIALDQSRDVKAKVEACSEDLGSANDLAKARIANGSERT
jgi:hypothetical protein